jgi:hypothetical protein
VIAPLERDFPELQFLILQLVINLLLDFNGNVLVRRLISSYPIILVAFVEPPPLSTGNQHGVTTLHELPIKEDG